MHHYELRPRVFLRIILFQLRVLGCTTTSFAPRVFKDHTLPAEGFRMHHYEPRGFKDAPLRAAPRGF